MWSMFGLLRLAALLPYPAATRVGAWLGRLIRLLSGRRQRIVEINLQRCLPQLSDDERRRIKHATYENLGISLIEMALCWWWPAHRLKPLVEVDGIEHIERCLKEKRGVILLTGHFTSLEIGGRLLTLFMPVQVMYRTQKNLLFDSYLFSKRDSYFENTVSRKNTRGLIRGIRDRIVTWYAPDQDFSRERNVFAPFFGIQAATISASARLAKSTGAAMLPYYPERKADGSGYVLHIEPPLQDFPSDDEVADASAINASIEKFVRRNPEHYMWVHQRFKSRPPGEPPFYR